MEEIDHQNASSVSLSKYDYTYDDANRITSETSSIGSTLNHTYDDIGQLLGDGAVSRSFDANGNRTDGSYTIGTSNRILSDGTYTYTYNDEGARATREDISTGYVEEYTYDHRNRLTSVVTKNSSNVVIEEVQYGYDALNNRINKSVDPDGAGSTPFTIEKFAYDLNGNAWADLDNSGSLVTRRLYEDAVDSLFARIDSGGVDWYGRDIRGSVTDIFDATGSLLNHIDFSGYGQVTAQTNSAHSDHYLYSSREYEAEIELQYNRSRYLDLRTGAWIAEDPIGFDAGDSNLQRYVENSFPNATDPNGLATAPNHSSNTIEETSLKIQLSPFTSGIGIAPLTFSARTNFSVKPSIEKGITSVVLAMIPPNSYGDKQFDDWSKGLSRERQRYYEKRFMEWYRKEKATGLGWTAMLPRPPAKLILRNGRPLLPNGWKWDSTFAMRWMGYHPNAAYGLRQDPPSITGAGTQAMYDAKGNLITGGLSAGTVDKFSTPLSKHMTADVYPYDWACTLDRMNGGKKYRNLYIEVRPVLIHPDARPNIVD